MIFFSKLLINSVWIVLSNFFGLVSGSMLSGDFSGYFFCDCNFMFVGE